MVGQPPEKVISQPRQGVEHQEGPFAGGRLALDCRPNRMDWSLSPSVDTEEEAETIANLGAFPTVLSEFLPIVREWLQLETSPAVKRLAFAAALLQPVESVREAYRRLAPYLAAVQLEPADTPDFVYAINRRRKSESGIPNLEINRLSKWSVHKLLTTGAQFVLTEPEVRILPGPVYHACRLQLDINTVKEFEGELPKSTLGRLFAELVSLAKEIVAEGDVK